MAEATNDAAPAATTDPGGVGQTDKASLWRLRLVCALAVALIALVGTLSWKYWYDGAPSVGDRGAATAFASCGLVSVDHDGYDFYSELGADGAAELEADWGNEQIPGRLHLDDRQRTDHREWTATGRFVADDGTEVVVSGTYGGKFMIVTADCMPS